MADNNLPKSERTLPFSMIEPLFYTELHNNYPFLPEWIFERMSGSVKTNRLILDKNNTNGGWLFVRYNGSGTSVFCACLSVIRNMYPNFLDFAVSNVSSMENRRVTLPGIRHMWHFFFVPSLGITWNKVERIDGADPFKWKFLLKHARNVENICRRRSIRIGRYHWPDGYADG